MLGKLSDLAIRIFPITDRNASPRRKRRSSMVHNSLHVVRNLAAKAGVLIGRLGEAPNWEYSFGLLEKAGLRPKTVFDIGVARGTLRLYFAFPDATFHLIEPIRESVGFMEDIAKRYKAHIHNVALGDRETELEIVIRDDIDGSTFFDEIGEAQIRTRYKVPVRRFGQVIDTFERPALAKIDVQGAELMVLKGMVDRLSEIDALVIEVSTIATLHGAPEMGDVISFLAQQNWSVADILSMSRRPLDGALAQLDLLCIPNSSPLRSDKRWTAGAGRRRRTLSAW
jgi:FkbM family methyltransferase